MSFSLVTTRTGLLACLTLGAIASAASGVAACSHDTDLHVQPDAGPAEGAPEASGPSGPTIEITTLAPTLTSAPAAKTSATWAAYQLDDGEWKTLAASSPGTYAVPVSVARWAIALVCASDDDELSTVFVHRRTVSTRSLEVSLEAQCAPEPPVAEFALTGTLSNLPPTTQWLDFGYARDTRGVVFPVSAGQAQYEQFGIAPGTWDLGFAVRDDSFGALTRVILLRGQVVSADRTLDIDGSGAASFTPATRRFVLRGLDDADTITPQVLYAAGGPHGIDLGPQNVPVGTTDVTLAYSTVPEAQQLASDRYHGAITAERDRRAVLRSIDFSIHQAIDLDVSLPPIVAAPAVVVLGTAPQVRLETRFPVLANAVRHEAIVLAETNRRTQHIWHATFDAAIVAGSAEVVDGMPDLSALPGWKSAWALPVGVTATVTARTYETPQPLGDGTMQRATGNSTTITP